jgi:Family of unknown function (DUF6278)
VLTPDTPERTTSPARNLKDGAERDKYRARARDGSDGHAGIPSGNDNGRMSQFWRQWLPGPKHGVARGIAVHGSPGFQRDAERLTDHLADCRKLRAWARDHGVDLDDTPGSLAALDEGLSPLTGETRRLLESDGGLYLGTVLVRHVHQGRWQVWPNGHPVVRLPSGGDLDVVAIVSNGARAGQPDLAALYADAIGDRPA